MIPMATKLLALLSVLGFSTGFAPFLASAPRQLPLTNVPGALDRVALFTKTPTGSSSTALWYRELKQDDDDAVMQKIQIRTPPGFKMQDNLNRKARTAMNVPLIRALLLNQQIIMALGTVVLALALLLTHGFPSFSNLNDYLLWTGQGPDIFDLALTPERILYGIAASLPLIALSTLVENSDQRAFANINFSTIAMVMTLFGRRTAPPPEFIPEPFRGLPYATTKTREALFQSLALSLTTGFCEEAVFRRQIPALIHLFTGNNLWIPFFGQALLFGLGHVQPKVGLMENSIVVSLQTINGFGFGLIYLLSGGDLVPCIVAHAFYDFVAFFKTWMDANGQIEYADAMFREPLPPAVDQEVQRILRESKMKIEPQVFNLIKRLFYTFDFDKNKTLSLSEVRKGIAYLALEKAGQPPPQSDIDRFFSRALQMRDNSKVEPPYANRMTFVDFVRLYTMMYNKKSDTASRSPVPVA